MLAPLLLSEGVPLLLGGDEFARRQAGNNNAYCQGSAPTIAWKLPARSVAARRIVYWPRRSDGMGAVAEVTADEKDRLPPWTMTIPTCEYFERSKQAVTGLPARAPPVSSRSTGRVFR